MSHTNSSATQCGDSPGVLNRNNCYQAANLCIYVIALFAVVVLTKTFVVWLGHPAIAIKDPKLLMYQTDSGSVAEVRGSFVSLSSQTVRISRELTHRDTKEIIVLPSSDKIIRPGEDSAASLFGITTVLMPGEWCMRYTLRWRPGLSLVDRVEELDMGCERPEPFLHNPQLR